MATSAKGKGVKQMPRIRVLRPERLLVFVGTLLLLASATIIVRADAAGVCDSHIGGPFGEWLTCNDTENCTNCTINSTQTPQSNLEYYCGCNGSVPDCCYVFVIKDTQGSFISSGSEGACGSDGGENCPEGVCSINAGGYPVCQ
jgi:hypothetical protein